MQRDISLSLSQVCPLQSGLYRAYLRRRDRAIVHMRGTYTNHIGAAANLARGTDGHSHCHIGEGITFIAWHHGRTLARRGRRHVTRNDTRLHAWSFGRTEGIQQGEGNRGGAALALTLALTAFSLAPAFASRRARAGRGSCRWDLTQTNTVAFESCTITLHASFLIE